MMVDAEGSNAQSLLGKIPLFDPKMKGDAKRGGGRLDEDFDSSNKRVKMRDLHSVLQSEVDPQRSRVVDKNPVERRGPSKSSTHQIQYNSSKPLDLNTELCPTDENSSYDEQTHRSRTPHFDLNAEDVASSAIQDSSLYPCSSHNSMKKRTILDFGRSTTGHSEDKEALKRWKEMKQNGFVSPTYGGIPVAPKTQRGRKSKNDVLRRKMELAKKEQVDRFTKIAAPSGLLNGLNPGIINHVRNSKQVHSIIQALVRSEKRDIRKQASETTLTTEQDNVNSSYDQAGAFSSSMQEMDLMGDMKLSRCSSSSHTEACFGSDVKNKNEDEEDILALKLSSSTTMASESNSCLSNVESDHVNGVDDLSVKAASVASQWLQLLQQDINGRLGALRRSRKRVQAVITTELPFLLSKEFSTHGNQDNGPHLTQSSPTVSSQNAALHQTRWSKLFSQLNTSLSEEEKELEHWLQQVTRMQEHCDQSLQHVQWNTLFGMNHLGPKDSQLRSQLKDSEKDLSVRAAAASIYSTCNFVSSRENVSCC